MYDFLIVGTGLFGAVVGRELTEAGRKVIILDKNNHIGGNVFTEVIEGIKVHKYGPHLFHTSSKMIWDYVNQFTSFNHYQHRVKATYDDKLYSLPFNMNTFHQLWGVVTPAEARQEIAKQVVPITKPGNLEEWALSQVGRDIYDKFIYGYTKKQWLREPRELPSFIIRRLPLRFTYDDNYFNDPYQGVPVNGYTEMVENILDGVEVRLNADFFDVHNWRSIARHLVYSGPIDAFFNYRHGHLEYRTLKFEQKVLDEPSFQGVGQMNYTDAEVKWTRIVEHKHFHFDDKTEKTVVTYEYPVEWKPGNPPYLPVNDARNNALYEKYAAEVPGDVTVGGRLGNYRYYDMDTTVGNALHVVKVLS